MSLAKHLQRLPSSQKTRQGPLWAGPCGEGPQGGVTQGLIGRYLSCRERFRILVTEGLKPADKFNHRLEYGNLWHACEEGLAAGTPANRWETMLEEQARRLYQQYPLDREKVEHWYSTCATQFPIYVDYWARHPDVLDRRPLFQEQVFDVPYCLPSGRVVRLRGKWDAGDLLGKGKAVGIYLQENKTKGDIYEPQMKRQLTFDLQTMTYLVALREADRAMFFEWDHTGGSHRYPVLGVRYNVVRRPFSGGKGNITRHKEKRTKKTYKPAETKEHFYQRLSAIIKEEPGYWFMRWKVEINEHDIVRFKKQFLDPVLENLYDDYEWWHWFYTTSGQEQVEDEGLAVWDYNDRARIFPGHQARHYRHPFGVYSPLDEGNASDLDAYLAEGSTVGLHRTDDLFPELK